MQKMHRFFISKNKIKNALKNKKAALNGQPFFAKKLNYASSEKYLIVLTICDVYEFSLSYHETT